MAVQLLAGIGSVLGGIFGGGSKKKLAAQKAAYDKKMKAYEAEVIKQSNIQAQESKKTIMYVGIGGAALVLVMIFMMKK